MSTDKKERNMTPRGFLHKSNTKAGASASGFLAQYRSYLETGELAEVTSPILRKLDDKALMPTPALEAIKAVVLIHMIAKDAEKANDSIQNPAKGSTARVKPWTSTIYNAKDEIQTRINDDGEEVELVASYDHPQDAERWVDRRLFEGQSDWYGVCVHSTITINGKPLTTTISRGDSIARLLKQKKGPVMQPQKGNGDGKLGFGAKVKESRCHFSKG